MNENLLIILVILIIIFINKYNSKVNNNYFPKGYYKHIGNDLNGNLIVSVHDKKEVEKKHNKESSSKTNSSKTNSSKTNSSKKEVKKKSKPVSGTSNINKNMFNYYVKDY